MEAADECRNIAGLDNVMNVLQTSPLVKKLPARKNELLHAFFRDSLARTKGEPIAMWLVLFIEQLGKLNRVVPTLSLLSQLEHGETCSPAEATRGHYACVHAVVCG